MIRPEEQEKVSDRNGCIGRLFDAKSLEYRRQTNEDAEPSRFVDWLTLTDRQMNRCCNNEPTRAKTRPMPVDLITRLVQSTVEDEDESRDQMTEDLWESPEYRAETLDEMVKCLDQATGSLISSAKEPRVAAMLARAGSSQ